MSSQVVQTTSYRRRTDEVILTLDNGHVNEAYALPPGERSNGVPASHNGEGITTSSHKDNGAARGNGRPPEGATLVFRDVCVTLSKKLILSKVCGMARVGQTLAIMGPSGAGKSTLLNTLGGRVPASSGSITLNGVPVTRHLRRKISYVQQQDVFYPNLTLRESLTFTTLLRLPDAMPRALKMLRMYEVVDALELKKCLDTKIGGTFVTGLSGGERKRASIACELLTNPRILILDEPTSGLDSAIAYSLMSTLSKYASQSHKTVVTTIHQPSSQIFFMFTNVLLITDGEVAYFGPGNKIIDFFSRLGFECELHYNPADFILERVKSGPENVKKILEGAYALRTEDSWPEELRTESEHTTRERGSREKQRLSEGEEGQTVKSVEHSDLYRTSLSGTDEVDVESYIVEGATWQTGFLTQFSTLTRRNFAQQRDRFLSKLNIGQILFMSVLAGLEWFQTDRSELQAQDRLGILFFVAIQQGFIPIMIAVFRIYDDSGVFIRERSSGVFRLSAFFLALMTAEVPVTFILTAIYGCIIYWMTGLMPAAGNFFGFLGVLILSAFTAQSFGFFVGSVVLNKPFVVPIANTMMITFLLVGGFYNAHVAQWFLWFRWTSYITYSLSALGCIEFEYGANLTCNSPNTTAFPEFCKAEGDTFPGTAFLKQQSLDVTPLYANILVLLGFLIVFRVATYIALRRTAPQT